MTLPAAKFDLAETPIERGITLIEASAGTGKTYCLTGLVLRLLLERNVAAIGNILVMTFTNAATAELVTRIRSTLRSAIRVFQEEANNPAGFLAALRHSHGNSEGVHILEAALRDLDDLEVCTIHGFCRRMLQENALETGTLFDVEYVEDAASLLTHAAEDFWRRVLYPAGDLVASIGLQRDWTPKFLATTYQDCRSHPGVVIVPEPMPAIAAIAHIHEAAQSVRAAWDRRAVERALRALRYKDALRFTEPLLQARLAELEAFCGAGKEAAVSAVLDTATAPLLKRLTEKGQREFVAFDFCAACDSLELAVRRLEHSLRCEFARHADELLEAEQRATGTAGFDDLLHRLRAALSEPARAAALRHSARRQFKAVLIDEFQDTDSIQYDIFRSLFGDAFLFLIGDPKQAIYGFRGADVFAYIRAKQEARQTYTLNSNWRSESRLVKAVTALFHRTPQPFRHGAIPFIDIVPAAIADAKAMGGDRRAPLQWIWIGEHGNKTSAARAACDATAREITALVAPSATARIGTDRVEPRNITVLVRSNDQAKQIQDTLRAAGIPAVVSRSGNVFEADEASDLHTLLCAILVPRDARAVCAALATRIWGCDASTIAALVDDDDRWQPIVEELEAFREAWIRDGFVAMAQRLLDTHDVRCKWLACTGGERRLTNLLHLLELANGAAAERHFSAEALVAWLASAIADPSAHAVDANELRLESDADAVQVATVHKSKGLEYDIVFCPFWDGRDLKLHPPLLVQTESGRAFYLCETPIDTKLLDSYREERQSEEARLAYVALTRAKHRCYVVWGKIGTNPETSALAHLLHGANTAARADAATWRTELNEFCHANADLMSVCELDELAAFRPERQQHRSTAALVARKLSMEARARLEPWRVASFSSFRASGATMATAPRPVVELPDHGDPFEPRSAPAAAGGILGFARGARVGTCLHEIIERCDFSRVTEPETEKLVCEVLHRHRLDSSRARTGDSKPERIVVEMLRDLTSCALPQAGFTLSQVEREARLNEWQFFLPMAAVSQRRLADCFARHGSGDIAASYARTLETLGEREVRGFLTGFVDLICQHEGRWYLFDWKSNYLGNTQADYESGALGRSMREHHYVLQYHLYVLALHRYLVSRLEGYDYDRHFGRVYYAYLRGIRADSSTGWYVDRPPLSLIEALDALMRDGSAT